MGNKFIPPLKGVGFFVSHTLHKAKRKRLGINKSTLWYQKKKLARGKRVKVYSKALAKLA